MRRVCDDVCGDVELFHDVKTTVVPRPPAPVRADCGRNKHGKDMLVCHELRPDSGDRLHERRVACDDDRLRSQQRYATIRVTSRDSTKHLRHDVHYPVFI